MKFSHSEEKRDGQHLDVLTDEEDGLRIIVSRLGAELISLARVDEAEIGSASSTGTTICRRRTRLGKSRHGDGLLFSPA